MARRGILDKKAVKKAFSDNASKKVDSRFYKPTKNSAGEISVLIRFLPSPDTASPFVNKTTHYFQENGVYSARCHSDIGKPCPVCETQNKTWNDGLKNEYRDRKKSLKHICNILVIKDPVKPENNGKVFLYEYTDKLHKKIVSKINPAKDSLEEPCMVFDWDEGANFKLIGVPDSFINNHGKNVDYFSYDNSSFESPSALAEKVADKADEGLYDLKPFSAESNFLSYDVAKAKFKEVTGETIANTPVDNVPAQEDEVDTSGVDEIMNGTPITSEETDADDEEFAMMMKKAIDD